MYGFLFYMIYLFPVFLLITVVFVWVYIKRPMSLFRKYNLELYQRIKPKIWIAYLIVILLFIAISVFFVYQLNQPITWNF